jgi:hypothetical protein
VLVYGIHNTKESQEKTMLYRLDDTCILKKSDVADILNLLFSDEESSLYEVCHVLREAMKQSLDGWVAVPYKASKKQLSGGDPVSGNTYSPISLGRWQSILALSPENPPTESM